MLLTKLSTIRKAFDEPTLNCVLRVCGSKAILWWLYVSYRVRDFIGLVAVILGEIQLWTFNL